MSEQTPDFTFSPPRRSSGRAVAIAAFIILLFITAFTYWVAPMFITPYFRAKPSQTQQLFAVLENAILQYASDNGGQFPPEDELLRYRRLNKNILRTRATGMVTMRVQALTSPIAYVDKFAIGDPYAVPEQWTPPAYVTRIFPDGTRVAVMSSPGPNLDYDVRPQTIREATSLEDLEARLAPFIFDPAKGERSTGDYVRLIVLKAP